MDNRKAWDYINDGHTVWAVDTAREVCEAFGVSFPKKLVKFFKNEAHPMGYHGQETDGVYSLELAAHVAQCLGVADQAQGFSGRGSQAREYARLVAEKLGLDTRREASGQVAP